MGCASGKHLKMQTYSLKTESETLLVKSKKNRELVALCKSLRQIQSSIESFAREILVNVKAALRNEATESKDRSEFLNILKSPEVFCFVLDDYSYCF